MVLLVSQFIQEVRQTPGKLVALSLTTVLGPANGLCENGSFACLGHLLLNSHDLSHKQEQDSYPTSLAVTRQTRKALCITRRVFGR